MKAPDETYALEPAMDGPELRDLGRTLAQFEMRLGIYPVSEWTDLAQRYIAICRIDRFAMAWWDVWIGYATHLARESKGKQREFFRKVVADVGAAEQLESES